MIEVASDTRTRDAYRAAHAARGEALGRIWTRLTGQKSSG